MKKNIRDDYEEQYLKIHLVNDNAMLIYTVDECNDARIHVRLRYVEDNCIKEQHITSFTDPTETIVSINDKNDAIAVFNRVDDGYDIDKVILLDTHTSVASDFLDAAYSSKFTGNVAVKKRGAKYDIS